MALGLGNTFNVSVKFLAEVDNMLRGIDSASGKLEAFGKKAQMVGKNMSMYITAPLVAMGTAAVNASLKMNKGMADVATLIPGNIKRVEELKRGVQDLAVTWGKSTSDLTRGLYEVISAFGDTNETMKQLEIASKLATAGVSTTLDALRLLSAITKGYGDTSAEAMLKASDLMMMVVKLGQTTFPELAASITGTIPLAASLGVKIEEVAALFATLTGVSGNAAEVGTQVEGMLAGLMKQTDAMADAIKNLGYETAMEMIQAEGLVGAYQKLLAATDGTQEAASKLLMRREGLTALFALVGGQAETFAEKMKAMGDAAGYTDEAVKEVTGGINKAGFTWDQFKAKLQVVAQQLGDNLAPALMDFMKYVVTPLITAVGKMAKSFSQMEPVSKAFIGILGGIVIAAGPVVYVIGTLIGAFGKFIPAIQTAIKYMQGPGGLIIATRLLQTTLVGLSLYLVTRIISDIIACNKQYNEMRKSVVELSNKTGEFTGKINALNSEVTKVKDKITEYAEAAGGVGKRFNDAKDAVIAFMNEHPDLRTEIGLTIDDSGDLVDVNGRVYDTFEDIQDLMNRFSMANARNEYKKTTMTILEELKKQADIYNESRNLIEVFWGWASGKRKQMEEDIEGLYKLYALYADEYIKSMEPEGDTGGDSKKKKRTGSDGGGVGSTPAGTVADPVYVRPVTAEERTLGGLWGRGEWPGSATWEKQGLAGRLYGTAGQAARGISGFMQDPFGGIMGAARDIWGKSLQPGAGEEAAGTVQARRRAISESLIDEEEAKKPFADLGNILMDGIRGIVESIQSGDIGSAVQNLFSMMGNTIASGVSQMIQSSVGGGGMFSSILGGLGGGLVGVGISLLGGLFGGGSKNRGTTPSEPIYVIDTNWDRYFKLGFTLAPSFIYSGRSDRYGVDPHGRTADGWSTGQHFDV